MPYTGLGSDMGADAKLYRNTGTHATPTWAEIENVVDLSQPDAFSEGNQSTRASRIKMYRKAMREVSIEWGMLVEMHDADFLAILAAYLDPEAALEILVLNDDITVTGARGIRAFVQIFSNNLGQPLEEGQTRQVVAKPTRYYENDVLILPSEHVVA
ncbi:MAG: hypothetical protein AAF961_11000 [Planctomycetota bacterium]